MKGLLCVIMKMKKDLTKCTLKDSGNRRTFLTGAKRDRGEAKVRPDLISPFFKFRIGEWLRLGADKYGERNWEKGIPQSVCVESLERHLMQYQMGLEDEDHLAAIACNIMFLLHNDEKIKRGLLDKKQTTIISDLPFYLKKK